MRTRGCSCSAAALARSRAIAALPPCSPRSPCGSALRGTRCTAASHDRLSRAPAGSGSPPGSSAKAPHALSVLSSAQAFWRALAPLGALSHREGDRHLRYLEDLRLKTSSSFSTCSWMPWKRRSIRLGSASVPGSGVSPLDI